MCIVIHTETGTLTPVAGTGSVNIKGGSNILMKMFVKPASSNTSFDITLTDIYDNVTLTREDNVGELNESDMGEPAYGNWTFTILNSSADELYDYLFVFRES